MLQKQNGTVFLLNSIVKLVQAACHHAPTLFLFRQNPHHSHGRGFITLPLFQSRSASQSAHVHSSPSSSASVSLLQLPHEVRQKSRCSRVGWVSGASNDVVDLCGFFRTTCRVEIGGVLVLRHVGALLQWRQSIVRKIGCFRLGCDLLPTSMPADVRCVWPDCLAKPKGHANNEETVRNGGSRQTWLVVVSALFLMTPSF